MNDIKSEQDFILVPRSAFSGSVSSHRPAMAHPVMDTPVAADAKDDKRLVESKAILPTLADNLSLMKASSSLGKSSLPPEIQTTMSIRHTFRFRANAGASNTVTTQGLFGICGVMALSSTTVGFLASSVRLRKIRIWNPATTTSTSLVYWGYSTAAGFIKDSSSSRTLPDGITSTGVQSFVPPKESLLGGWLSSTLSSGNTVCTIGAPTGAIIDIDIEFTIGNLVASYNALTVSSATLGRIYYLPLDGVSANNLRAQGVSTTS